MTPDPFLVRGLGQGTRLALVYTINCGFLLSAMVVAKLLLSAVLANVVGFVTN